MHIPSPFRDRPTSVELQLTPMIDCVFLLMVYFIWSSSFAISEMSLASKLSAAPTTSSGGASATEQPPPEADFPSVVVRILWNGAPIWTMNDAPVSSLAELRQRFASLASIKRDAPVILDPDGDVPLGDVIDVFDLSRLAGFQTIQFAAAAPVER